MQIKSWFDRKRIAILGLLFIVLISLNDPYPNISEIINREINLNKARDYNCLAEHIPTAEDVLFIGNPFDDPTNSNNGITGEDLLTKPQQLVHWYNVE